MKKYKSTGAFDGLTRKQIKTAIKYCGIHYGLRFRNYVYKEFSNDLKQTSLYQMFPFDSPFVKGSPFYWRKIALRQSNKKLNIEKRHLIGALYGLTIKQAKKVVKYVQQRTDIAGITFSYKEAYYFCTVSNSANNITFLFNFDKTKEGADYWLDVWLKQETAMRKRNRDRWLKSVK